MTLMAISQINSPEVNLALVNGYEQVDAFDPGIVHNAGLEYLETNFTNWNNLEDPVFFLWCHCQ